MIREYLYPVGAFGQAEDDQRALDAGLTTQPTGAQDAIRGTPNQGGQPQ
jgi:hypothetical protein